MKYEEMSTQKVVEYINEELLKNRTMKEIEEKDFEENKGVIQKRLNRKGYVRVNNQFVSAKDNNTINTTDKIQSLKNNNTEKNTTILQDTKIQTTNKAIKIIQEKTSKKEGQKAFSNVEIEKLNQLLKLDFDTLNKMIKDYTTKENTKSSINIKDNSTVVTSIRLNKELYNKIKEYSKKENIKLQDIFNEMMMNYVSKNVK